MVLLNVSAPYQRQLAVPVSEPSHRAIWLTVPVALVTTEAAAARADVALAARLKVTAKRGQDARGLAVPVSPGSAVWRLQNTEVVVTGAVVEVVRTLFKMRSSQLPLRFSVGLDYLFTPKGAGR